MRKQMIAFTAAVMLALSFFTFGSFALEEGTEAAPARRYGSFGLYQEDAAALGLSAENYALLRERIFGSMRDCAANCSLSDLEIPRNQSSISILSRIVYKDDPLCFHADSVSFSYNSGTNTYTKINFTYKYDKAVYEQMLAECEAAAQEMTADLADSGLSQAELALILHDRLAARCAYDYDNYLQGSVPDQSYTMYGSLINRISVCEGYTMAYIYLLDLVGINSRMCSSNALNHAWNLVEIDGQLYHVDVTWDDPVYDMAGRVIHENFLRSTAGIVSSGHNASDFDSSPQDTAYDDGWWRTEEIGTQICYLNGVIYYVDPTANRLMIRQGDGAVPTSADLQDRWYAGPNSVWGGNYCRLACDGTFLYYNLSDGIWRYDPASDKATECFRPDLSQFPDYSYIFSLTVDGGEFVYEIFNSPNFTAEVRTLYRFREPIPEPEAVIAVSVEAVLPLRKTVYSVGSRFDPSTLQLLVTYSDGSEATVTEGFTVQYDFTAAGERTVTVDCEDCQTQFTVTVTDLTGDADGDGEVTSTDARIVLVWAGGNTDLIPDEVLSDVNGDGTVNTTDARLILQYAVECIDDWSEAA